MPPASPANPLACRVWCGIPALTALWAALVPTWGGRIDPAADAIFLVDLPLGYALHTVDRVTPPLRLLLILTFNSCPQYGDDLWDGHPQGLIAGPVTNAVLVEGFQQVAAGQRYRTPPAAAPELSPLERRILTGLAQGWTNQQIAQRLHFQEKSVRNSLTTIYEKLELRNRLEASLYYWGLGPAATPTPTRPELGTNVPSLPAAEPLYSVLMAALPRPASTAE